MKILQYILYSLAILFLITSCTDDFEEMNKNPMVATDMPYGYEFSHSQLDFGGKRYPEWRSNLILSSSFSGLTLSTFSTGGGFKNNDEYNSSRWNESYQNEIKDIEDLLSRIEDIPENENLIAAARVLKVFYYQRLTDLYGDIPYFQGGKGYIDNVINPAYDSQELIYKDFIKELTEANAQFNSENSKTYGNHDLLFNGDVEKWKKFTNSLKARIGMRLTKVDPALAESTVKDAIESGVMTSFEDQANLFPIEDGGQWGIHQNATSNSYRAENGRQFPSKGLMKSMKTSKDPRIFIYFAKCYLKSSDGYMPYAIKPNNSFDPFAQALDPSGSFDPSVNYIGYPAGASDDLNTEYFVKTDTAAGDPQYHSQKWKSYSIDDEAAPNTYTYLNPLTIMDITAPIVFMSYAETEFLVTEAIHRGWTSGSAKDHYETGIRAAMKMARELYPNQDYVDDIMLLANDFNYEAGVDNYINNPNIKWDPSKGLELIAVEKWKTFISNGYEAFAEVRRTGFPSFVKDTPDQKEMRPVYYYDPVSESVDLNNKIEDREITVYQSTDTEGQRPRRFTYPNRESSINKAAYNAAIAKLQYGNNYRSRVWWDK